MAPSCLLYQVVIHASGSLQNHGEYGTEWCVVYTVCSKKTTIGVFFGGDIAFLMVSDWALVWYVEPFIRSLLVLFVKVSHIR